MWRLNEEEAKESYSSDQFAQWQAWRDWAAKFRAEGFNRFSLIQRETYSPVWVSSKKEEIYTWRGDDEYEWTTPLDETVATITDIIFEIRSKTEENLDKQVCKLIAELVPEYLPKVVNPNQELLEAFYTPALKTKFRFWGERYTVIRGGDDLAGGHYLVALSTDGSDFLALWQNRQLWMVFGTQLSMESAKGVPTFPTAPTAWFHLYTKIIDENFNED